MVDVGRMMPAYGQKRGSARYKAAHDLDGNGVVDIADVAIVVARFGGRC